MQISVNNVVLRHDIKNKQNQSTKRKLLYKWLGLYCVQTALIEKGTYKLKEFNRTCVLGTHLGNWLKKFIERKGFYKPVKGKEEEDNDEEEEGDKINKVEEMGEVEAESKGARAEFKLIDFEIQLPTLTAEQRS